MFLIIINIIGFILMYEDKKRAVLKLHRISEKTLILVCIVGGSIGTLIGMYKFRHKTKKIKFIYGVPFILMVNIFIFFIS